MSSQPAVAVFGSSQTIPGSEEWDQAESAGAELARHGYAVVTGGYQGTMAAASKGAVEVGGITIGVTAPPLFPGRHGANKYVTELIEAKTIPERIGVMMDRVSGALALPGSIGTATELLIAWNINHITRRNGGRMLPTVAVGSGWATVTTALVNEVGANPDDIYVANTASEAVRWLVLQLKSRKSTSI